MNLLLAFLGSFNLFLGVWTLTGQAMAAVNFAAAGFIYIIALAITTDSRR